MKAITAQHKESGADLSMEWFVDGVSIGTRGGLDQAALDIIEAARKIPHDVHTVPAAKTVLAGHFIIVEETDT